MVASAAHYLCDLLLVLGVDDRIEEVLHLERRVLLKVVRKEARLVALVRVITVHNLLTRQKECGGEEGVQLAAVRFPLCHGKLRGPVA